MNHLKYGKTGLFSQMHQRREMIHYKNEIMREFIIINGVLKHYIGPGGDVVIPDSVTSIESSAFYFCGRLTSVYIPNSVISIGRLAFGRCNGLTHIHIPESVVSIEEDILDGCYNLSVITAPTVSFQIWKNHNLDIPAAMGYLTKPELYQNPDIVAEYKRYISRKVQKLCPRLFKDDMVQGLAILASLGRITAKNLEAHFLRPAQEANATECVAYLLEWKNRNIDQKQQRKQLEKEFQL